MPSLRVAYVDTETTGLSSSTDRIIEIAVVVTDAQISTRVEGPVFAIHQSDAVLDAMDAWNKIWAFFGKYLSK